MHVGRAKTARPPDDYTAVLIKPLEHGAWAYAELLPHLCRNRDLALSRDS